MQHVQCHLYALSKENDVLAVAPVAALQADTVTSVVPKRYSTSTWHGVAEGLCQQLMPAWVLQ